MSDKTGNAKLGAAVLGGYVLGRTKKLKAGVRLAMWLAGDTGGPLPRVVGAGRSGISSLAGSDEVKALGEQVRGPLTEALQRAAMASLTSRLDRLATGIQNRTDKLNSTVEGTAGAVTEGATDAVTGTADTAKKAGGELGKLGGKKDNNQNGNQNGKQNNNQEQDQQEQNQDNQDQEQHQDDQQNQEENQGNQDENQEQHQDENQENREHVDA